jgi:hypothetical protein
MKLAMHATLVVALCSAANAQGIPGPPPGAPAAQSESTIDLASLQLIATALQGQITVADANLVAKQSVALANWRQSHADEWNQVAANSQDSYAALLKLSFWPTPDDAKSFVLALIRVMCSSQINAAGDQLLQNYVSEYNNMKSTLDAIGSIRDKLPLFKVQQDRLSAADKNSISGAADAFVKATQ